MNCDLVVSWDQHLKNGNVWRVEVELPMQDGPLDNPTYYTVCVDVVAPNLDLAQYIATTMYPDHTSICIDDKPFGIAK